MHFSLNLFQNIENMTAKEKILLCCKALGLTPYKVATELGMRSSSFAPSSMGSSLNADALFRFFEIHPEISAEWMLRGEGDMLRSSEPVAMDKQGISKGNEKELLDTIRRQQREIDGLYERIEELKKTNSIAATTLVHTA